MSTGGGVGPVRSVGLAWPWESLFADRMAGMVAWMPWCACLSLIWSTYETIEYAASDSTKFFCACCAHRNGYSTAYDCRSRGYFGWRRRSEAEDFAPKRSGTAHRRTCDAYNSWHAMCSIRETYAQPSIAIQPSVYSAYTNIGCAAYTLMK